MKLPNGNLAIVDIEKLEAYCLNPEHPKGKHKARVFSSGLGLTAADAPLLMQALLGAAQRGNVSFCEIGEHGELFVVDFLMENGTRSAEVRSVWIIRTDENAPRLVSCYAKKGRKA